MDRIAEKDLHLKIEKIIDKATLLLNNCISQILMEKKINSRGTIEYNFDFKEKEQIEKDLSKSRLLNDIISKIQTMIQNEVLDLKNQLKNLELDLKNVKEMVVRNWENFTSARSQISRSNNSILDALEVSSGDSFIIDDRQKKDALKKLKDRDEHNRKAIQRIENQINILMEFQITSKSTLSQDLDQLKRKFSSFEKNQIDCKIQQINQEISEIQKAINEQIEECLDDKISHSQKMFEDSINKQLNFLKTIVKDLTDKTKEMAEIQKQSESQFQESQNKPLSLSQSASKNLGSLTNLFKGRQTVNK